MRSVILTSFGGLDALELADLPGPAVPEGDEVGERPGGRARPLGPVHG